MTIDARPAKVTGNPVRTESLLRSLRSNGNAVILTLWSVLVAAIGIAVLVRRIGLSQPFRTGTAFPDVIGASLAQWWMVTVGVGIAPLAVVLAVVGGGGVTVGDRVRAWSPTLVGPWRVALGLWTAQLALICLALVLSLPVAGLAVALGGTPLRPLGVALAGSFVCAAAVSAFTIALACRARRTIVPLVVALVVVAAVDVVPYAVHVMRDRPSGDVVMTVVPLVGIADAAAPLPAGDMRFGCGPGVPCWNPVDAAMAPLHGVRETVHPWDQRIPPWGWTTLGAVLVAGICLVVTRALIARPPRS